MFPKTSKVFVQSFGPNLFSLQKEGEGGLTWVAHLVYLAAS